MPAGFVGGMVLGLDVRYAPRAGCILIHYRKGLGLLEYSRVVGQAQKKLRGAKKIPAADDFGGIFFSESGVLALQYLLSPNLDFVKWMKNEGSGVNMI